MSILIKGIEMPTEPTPVTLYPDGHWNNYLDGSIGKFSHLPEKHGRLIDADALKHELMVSGIIDFYGTQINIKIDNAPTVAEAEGGSEDG